MKMLMAFVLLFFLAKEGYPDSSLRKAIELLDRGNTEEVLNILSKHIPEDRELPIYNFLYGQALFLTGKTYESVNYFRLAYILSTDQGIKEQSLLQRARAYFESGFYEEAAACFRLFLLTFPKSPLYKRAQLGLADSMYKLGLYDQAIEQYEKLGNTVAALYGKANCLQAMGKTKEAYNLYMSLITREVGYLGSSLETRYNLAENLRQMGKLQDARVYLASIINESRDPDITSRAEISLGLIEVKENNFESAIRLFTSASKSLQRKTRSKALLYLADLYMKQQRPQDSIPILLQIRNEYPYSEEYDKATIALAIFYKEAGKLEESIKLLKELAFRANPNPDALEEIRLILTDLKEKDPEGFLKLWNTCKRFFMKPSNSEFLVKILDGLRENQMPFLELSKWLAENAQGRAKRKGSLYMAEFFTEMGDKTQALKYIAEYLNEEDDRVLRIKAKILKLDHRYYEAFKTLQSISDIKREDLALLSSTLNRLKDKREVLDFYEASLKKTEASQEEYITLADALYQTNRPTDALRYYRIASSIENESKISGVANDRDWANYMLSKLTGEKEPISKIEQTKGIMKQIREVTLKELEIEELIKGEL